MTALSPGGLASLPPPPSSLPPFATPRASSGPVFAEEGLREPSLPPPGGEPVDPLTTLYPPMLSLEPPSVQPTPVPAPSPAPDAMSLSLAPEALELDLSVLGPSELPAEPEVAESVPMVELDVAELDEVRLSIEPQAPRKVAPPLPPPVLRRAR